MPADPWSYAGTEGGVLPRKVGNEIRGDGAAADSEVVGGKAGERLRLEAQVLGGVLLRREGEGDAERRSAARRIAHRHGAVQRLDDRGHNGQIEAGSADVSADTGCRALGRRLRRRQGSRLQRATLCDCSYMR